MRRSPSVALLLAGTLAVGACASEASSEAPDHLACGPGTPLAPGNECCADGLQRPDCTATVNHAGYWEMPCPAPLATTCAGEHGETFEVAAAGTLVALYTTGPLHVMPGRVKVTLDGVEAGFFEAALPGGTVNPPLSLGPVTSGSHTIVLQFSSTSGENPANWGGFLDLFVN